MITQKVFLDTLFLKIRTVNYKNLKTNSCPLASLIFLAAGQSTKMNAHWTVEGYSLTNI